MPRAATCPTWPPSTGPSATTWPDSTSDLLRRLDRFCDEGIGPPPLHRGVAPGAREAGARGLSPAPAVCSILRSPAKLKYLAGSESGSADGSTTYAPETVAARLREVAS